jgi:hypothetical protein
MYDFDHVKFATELLQSTASFELLVTEPVAVFIIHILAKFYMPSCSSSLLITIKLKAKYRIHAAAMLFYIHQEIVFTKDAYFSNNCYHSES